MHAFHILVSRVRFQQKRKKKNICKMGGVEEIKNKSAICSIDCQLCHQEETKKKTFFEL